MEGSSLFRSIQPLILALFLMLFTIFFVNVAEVRAETPILLTDISPGSRIELEAGMAETLKPVESDGVHYLLHMELEVIENGHFRIGVPFSGYTGPLGRDNFIRGNLMGGFSYNHPFTDWFRLGGVVRLYFPTYESAETVDFGWPSDPRRAALMHWHTRFEYAFEDYFPFETQLTFKFEKWGVFLQGEGGWTYAVRTEKNRYLDRPRHVQMGQYGLSLGYKPIEYVEFGLAAVGLVDPEPSIQNLEALLAAPKLRSSSRTSAVSGIRLAYEWAYAAFSASFPLESEFRRSMHPTYLFTFGVRFGRMPPYDGWGEDAVTFEKSGEIVADETPSEVETAASSEEP